MPNCGSVCPNGVLLRKVQPGLPAALRGEAGEQAEDDADGGQHQAAARLQRLPVALQVLLLQRHRPEGRPEPVGQVDRGRDQPAGGDAGHGEQQRPRLQLGPEDLGVAGLVEPQVVDVDVGQRADGREQHQQHGDGADNQLRAPRQGRHRHGGPHGHERSPSVAVFGRGRVPARAPVYQDNAPGGAGFPARRQLPPPRARATAGRPGQQVAGVRPASRSARAVRASSRCATLASGKPGSAARRPPRRSCRRAPGTARRRCRAAATIFSAMPPIGPDRALGVDRPGAGHHVAAGQVVVPHQVEDAEGQHQAGRRAADVLDLDVDVERRRRLVPDGDAEQRAVAVSAPPWS